MNRTITLTLVLLLVLSSLIVVVSAAIPSVPEFTVKYVDNSYDVPPSPTTTTNPFNGKTTTNTIPGYHVANKSIQVTIKSQPFTYFLFKDSLGVHEIYLHYNLRYKGHFGDEWHYDTASIDSVNPPSDYKVVRYALDNYGFLSGLSSGDQVDFQVQALIGYYYLPEGHDIYEPGALQFEGDKSSWSSIQTLTIPGAPSSVGPSPTVPEVPTLAIVPLFVSMLFIAVILRYQKTSNQVGSHHED